MTTRVDLSHQQWLEKTLHCSIKELGSKQVMTFMGAYNMMGPDMVTQSEAMYSLNIAASDLDYLIRVVREAEQEKVVHKYYPNLKDAYYDYKYQVALTVDTNVLKTYVDKI